MTDALLFSTSIDTPLGLLLAIGDESALYFLKFTDERSLAGEIERFALKTKMRIVARCTDVHAHFEQEMYLYFEGQLKRFMTPLRVLGSDFQKQAWQALAVIPCGQTRSYAQQAAAIGNPKAWRAVANANASNPLPLVLPCHRVIQSNGRLGGYSGGLDRKRWLLTHEKRIECIF